VDSRACVFLFPVDSAADIPGDFRASVQGRLFETGVFLPQDDANSFMAPPRYPARLLLLNDHSLYIVPHPTAQQPTAELILDELAQLETGTSLLAGWIQFSTRSVKHHLIYNTRASRPLEKFIAAVRRRWLGTPSEPSQSAKFRPQIFGQELNVKLRNLLHDELGLDEVVLSQYFAAPAENQDKFLVFRRITWRPGHLLVLTSGHRLLWLKDEYRGRCNRYAGIAISVRSSSLLECFRLEKTSYDDLVMHFASGLSWRISICGADSDCAGFLRTLNCVLHLES
jgi:hypothetical protein